MKAVLILIAETVAVLTLATTARLGADPGLEAHYQARIQHRIAQYQHKCRFVQSGAPALREYGRQAMGRFRFLRSHQDRLRQELLRHKVVMKPHAVDYFLIKAYAAQTMHVEQR